MSLENKLFAAESEKNGGGETQGGTSAKSPLVKCHVSANAQETGSYQPGNEVGSTGRLIFPLLLSAGPF